MTRTLVAWARVAVSPGSNSTVAPGERATAVARDERVAVARPQRRRRHRRVGVAADPLSGRGEVPFHRSAERGAEHRLGQAAGRVAGVERPRHDSHEAACWRWSVMPQRAYARPAQRLARRDGGGG
jgi:hypothetical protein